MIANRYATEGVEDTRGVKLLEKDKLPASAIAGQAIGFRPAKVVEAQERGFKASAAEKAVDEEKNKIANDIKDNFRKSIDLDKPADYQQRFEAKFEETLEKMWEFNGKHPEKAFASDAVFDLILSDAELKANLGVNAGVKITPENARLLGDAVDKAIKALESYDKKEQ
jgi:type I site-specific restriction endonuclease